ncbi:ABC transporter permease [Vallitaleaceae bacterium 9-2]
MGKIRNFVANEKNHKVLIPLIAIFMGFLIGSFIMLITKQSPAIMFKSMIRAITGINLDRLGTDKWFSARIAGEYFVYVMPIVLTGLSVAFAFRTGLFNIGAEGQLLMGAFATTVIGINLDLPKIILLPLVIIAGAVAGGLWGFIPGYLKAKFNVHEVVVTIMLNYTALHLTNYLMKLIPGSTSNKTEALNENALLGSELLRKLTSNSRLNFGFIVVILAVFLFWFIINKTTFGYELKAVGFNPFAAKYAGMKVERNAALSMAIAGAFSGLAGVIIVSGTFGYGRMIASFENYGFDGIAVALIGGNTAIGSLLSGLLLGALKAAQPIMQGQGVPNAIATIITATIIIFVAMQKGIQALLKKVKGAK